MKLDFSPSPPPEAGRHRVQQEQRRGRHRQPHRRNPRDAEPARTRDRRHAPPRPPAPRQPVWKMSAPGASRGRWLLALRQRHQRRSAAPSPDRVSSSVPNSTNRKVRENDPATPGTSIGSSRGEDGDRQKRPVLQQIRRFPIRQRATSTIKPSSAMIWTQRSAPGGQRRILLAPATCGSRARHGSSRLFSRHRHDGLLTGARRAAPLDPVSSRANGCNSRPCREPPQVRRAARQETQWHYPFGRSLATNCLRPRGSFLRVLRVFHRSARVGLYP